MTILNYNNLFYVLLYFTTSFTTSVSSQQWYRATARINFQFPATESTQPMTPATERIFEDVSFEFIRNFNATSSIKEEEMQIVDADMMSQSILYDDYTLKYSLYIELRVEALYETKKTSDARDQELKRHVEDVFRGGVNDFTAQLRAESTYFDTILAGGGSLSSNNNNDNNSDGGASNTDTNGGGTNDKSSTDSSSSSNNNNNDNNSDGNTDTNNNNAEGLVVHPAFWVAGTLCAVAILSVVGFAYTYIQHRRNLFQFKAMHGNNHSDIGSNMDSNSNMDHGGDNNGGGGGVHARIADDAAASDISSLPESAYFHCSPSVDSTSMLPPTVILEREQNATATFKKYHQRQQYDDDDDVESGGNKQSSAQQQSVCVSDTDVSDYDFSKAGMKDNGSISTNESSFVRPSLYNKATTKPKISVSTPETVPEDLASYKESSSGGARSSRSRCSSPATSVASSKHSRRSVQSASNNNAPHTSTMRRQQQQQQQQVSSSSYSVLDFVPPPPPPPPPPRSGSPTHSAGGSKGRRRSASLEPRRLAFGNEDGTSYNNNDGGSINPVSPPLINRAPAPQARRSVSLEPRRSPAAAAMNHHHHHTAAAPPLPSIPIAPRYATTNASASGRRSSSNAEATARGRRSLSAGPPVASSVNRMAMAHSVDRWMESKVTGSNNVNTTNVRSRSMSLSAGERSNHQQYQQQQQQHAYYSSPAITPPRSPHSRHSPRSHSSPSSEGRKSPYTSLYLPGCGNAGDESSGSAYPPSTDDSSPLMNRHVLSSSAVNQNHNKAISSTRYSPPRQELMDAISTVSRELEKISASGSDNDATAVDRNSNGRYLCEVARGPLRVIIDTGSHTDDRPLLYSIKPASPLSGKANEGDVIFKVDGVDTKGMTGERLAKLVKRKQAGSDADPKVCKLIIMSSSTNKSQAQC